MQNIDFTPAERLQKKKKKQLQNQIWTKQMPPEIGFFLKPKKKRIIYQTLWSNISMFKQSRYMGILGKQPVIIKNKN